MTKKKIYGGAFLAAGLMIGLAHGATAETCYAVEGDVATTNVSATTQVGSIKLVLSGAGGDVVFDETGALVGTITGQGPIGQVFLSHTASFPTDSFVTNNDTAIITGIRKFDDQGIPCSFTISETISEIASGTGFFSSVSRVNIQADGYIAICLEGGNIAENENEFELSGELCVE